MKWVFQNVPDDICPYKELRKYEKMFAGCVLETSKDNLKALLGLVVWAQIVSILLDGKCQRALCVAAKNTVCV